MKEKASQVKTAGVKSYSSAREKYASSGGPSTAKAKPPPPPPPRKSPGKQRGDLHAPSESSDVNKIDWANLSHEDKQVFFTWLDEFFARYLDQPPTSVRVSHPADGLNPSTPSQRPSPSLPLRREASQNTGSDQADVIPTATAVGRRALPPVLSQHGPVRILCIAREPSR